MATVGLELVDAALLAVRDRERLIASPGIALVAPEGVVVGAAAAAAARLRPAFAVDRFWSELSVEPLARPGTTAVTHAHLAEAHLALLWAEVGGPDEVLALAVPGVMRPRQLGLALGIARQLAIPIASCVDAAVAACADLPARELVLHLDVQLHQSVLTLMDGAQRLRRRQVAVAPRVGLRVLHAAWAQLISDAMVRSTRFDPLHEAATDQRLHEQLPEWLAALAGAMEVEAAIDTRTASFATTLQRDQFILAAEAWYTQLVELVQGSRPAGEPATLALSARAAALPGLRERLAALPGLEVAVLPEVAAAAGAARHAAGAADEASAPALLIALPRSHAAAPEVRKPAPHGAGPGPTHVLLAGRAHALGAGPLVLGSDPGSGRGLVVSGSQPGISRRHCTLERRADEVVVRDHSRFGTFVNGTRVAGTAVLAPGDRLRLGTPGVVLELVAVD
jgi:hypothetical protein